jgi:hypothetical protein
MNDRLAEWTIRLYRQSTDSHLSVPFVGSDPGLNMVAIIEIGQELIATYEAQFLQPGWEILVILPPGNKI